MMQQKINHNKILALIGLTLILILLSYISISGQENKEPTPEQIKNPSYWADGQNAQTLLDNWQKSDLIKSTWKESLTPKQRADFIGSLDNKKMESLLKNWDGQQKNQYLGEYAKLSNKLTGFQLKGLEKVPSDNFGVTKDRKITVKDENGKVHTLSLDNLPPDLKEIKFGEIGDSKNFGFSYSDKNNNQAFITGDGWIEKGSETGKWVVKGNNDFPFNGAVVNFNGAKGQSLMIGTPDSVGDSKFPNGIHMWGNENGNPKEIKGVSVQIGDKTFSPNPKGTTPEGDNRPYGFVSVKEDGVYGLRGDVRTPDVGINIEGTNNGVVDFTGKYKAVGDEKVLQIYNKEGVEDTKLIRGNAFGYVSFSVKSGVKLDVLAGKGEGYSLEFRDETLNDVFMRAIKSDNLQGGFETTNEFFRNAKEKSFVPRTFDSQYITSPEGYMRTGDKTLFSLDNEKFFTIDKDGNVVTTPLSIDKSVSTDPVVTTRSLEGETEVKPTSQTESMPSAFQRIQQQIQEQDREIANYLQSKGLERKNQGQVINELNDFSKSEFNQQNLENKGYLHMEGIVLPDLRTHIDIWYYPGVDGVGIGNDGRVYTISRGVATRF